MSEGQIELCPLVIEYEGRKCGRPADRPVRFYLPDHDYVRYAPDVRKQRIMICAEHAQLISDGWKLESSLIFRWVPPK